MNTRMTLLMEKGLISKGLFTLANLVMMRIWKMKERTCPNKDCTYIDIESLPINLSRYDWISVMINLFNKS